MSSRARCETATRVLYPARMVVRQKRSLELGLGDGRTTASGAVRLDAGREVRAGSRRAQCGAA